MKNIPIHLAVLSLVSILMMSVLFGCDEIAEVKTSAPGVNEITTVETSKSGELEISWLIGEYFFYSQDCISGDTLVGREYEYAEGKMAGEIVGQYITTFDLNSHEKKRILQIPADRRVGTPSIYQNKIVWESVDRNNNKSSFPPENYDIFLLDLDTDKVTRLTNDEHAQRTPRIYGDTVIWVDARNKMQRQYPFFYDIYAYNLKTGQETRITENPTVENYDEAAINGSIIVWTDMRHADWNKPSHADNEPAYNNEIYAYDLNTGKERRLTTSLKNDHYPAISGSTVTWLRQEDYMKADIFSFNLVSGLETQISHSSYADFFPSIYGNRIVWTDARATDGNTNNDVVINGQDPGADIYLYNLETKTETKLTVTEDRKIWAFPVMRSNHLIYLQNRQIGPVVCYMNLSTLPIGTSSVAENHSLDYAKPYIVLNEGNVANDDPKRSVGLWYITSDDANSFEEYAQTAVQATLDLYTRYKRNFTSVLLIPENGVEISYAQANFAADGKGAAGMTGDAPANPGYWKVWTSNRELNQQELDIAALWEAKQQDFPQTVPFSSLSYDHDALRRYIANTLNIPYDEAQLPDLKMYEYELDQSFIAWTISLASRPHGNPVAETSLNACKKSEFGEAEKAAVSGMVSAIPADLKNQFEILYAAAVKAARDPLWEAHSSWRPYTRSFEYQVLLEFCREEGHTVWPLLFQKFDSESPHFAGGVILDVTIDKYLYYFMESGRQTGTQSVKADFSAYVKELLALLEENYEK